MQEWRLPLTVASDYRNSTGTCCSGERLKSCEILIITEIDQWQLLCCTMNVTLCTCLILIEHLLNPHVYVFVSLKKMRGINSSAFTN